MGTSLGTLKPNRPPQSKLDPDEVSYLASKITGIADEVLSPIYQWKFSAFRRQRIEGLAKVFASDLKRNDARKEVHRAQSELSLSKTIQPRCLSGFIDWQLETRIIQVAIEPNV